MSTIQSLSKVNFRSVVEDVSTPVLVDFWAPWCGPCRLISPELEAAAAQLGSKVRFAKVNVDEEPEIAEQFGIQSIPNLIVFREGKPVRQFIGFLDRRSIVSALQ